MTDLLKRIAFHALESPWFVRALRATGGRGCATMLMHRFRYGTMTYGRHDPAKLRSLLAGLRAAGIDFVSLDDAVKYCAEKEAETLPRLAVSFTIDDGYEDFAEVAWPIFKEFDCPVGIFVVPSVVEQRDWFWWDKLDWVMRNTESSSVELTLSTRLIKERWTDDFTRFTAYERIANLFKQEPAVRVPALLDELSQRAGVTLPTATPAEYRVLGWEELRKLERAGVRVGPHTMTHPVLSRCEDGKARDEIFNSVAALRRELENPLPIFCYPNGLPADQGAREHALVQEAGVPFAFTTSGGVLRPQIKAEFGNSWPWQLPRIGYEEQAGRIIRKFVT